MNAVYKAAWLAAVMTVTPVAASAQDQARVYDQGGVVAVTLIDVEPGQFDAYMANLNGLWRRSMEEGKRRGEILNYMVVSNMAAGPGDPDVLTVVTYRDAAVMDTSLDELDRRTAAMQGSVEAASRATVERGRLRTILGNELWRIVTFR